MRRWNSNRHPFPVRIRLGNWCRGGPFRNPPATHTIRADSPPSVNLCARVGWIGQVRGVLTGPTHECREFGWLGVPLFLLALLDTFDTEDILSCLDIILSDQQFCPAG